MMSKRTKAYISSTLLLLFLNLIVNPAVLLANSNGPISPEAVGSPR